MCSEGTPYRNGRGRDPRPAAMRRSFRPQVRLSEWIPRVAPSAGMRRPFSGANRRSRISGRQGSLLPAGRVRWPRFPHLARRPHPSRHGSESASSHPAPCEKDVRRGVRRRDRGQRPTATKDPNPKPRRRRDAATVAGYAGPGFYNWPSGHIPQDNGSETASSHPAPWQKDVRRGVRRRDRGQRPTATEDPNTKPTAQAATPPL